MAGGLKKFVYKSVALGFFLYISYNIHVNKRPPSDDPNVKIIQRFSFRYLTNWTFTSELVYFSLGVLAILLGVVSTSLGNQLDRVANHLAISVAGPMSMYVTVVFWSIYSIDRELVLPKSLDHIITPFINHSIHTMNFALMLIDFYLFRHYYPKSHFNPLRTLICYLLAYSVCLFGTYFSNGIWLYPFLNLLSWPQIAAATGATLVSAVAFYYITLFINRLIWGTTVKTQAKTHTKKRK